MMYNNNDSNNNDNWRKKPTISFIVEREVEKNLLWAELAMTFLAYMIVVYCA